MNEQERELDLMVAELEQENRLLRARNERLEREALADIGNPITEQPDMNLSCKSVQARLAASWDYVKAEQPAQQQEPHGYLKLSTAKFFHEVEGTNPMTDKNYLPLYTSPPASKPLTGEELCAVIQAKNITPTFTYRLIARAIEAAHGIKG